MKIESISFGPIPFRMFKDMTINISERLTVIAGHNGIGKSTLLGLIANGSELKSKHGRPLLKSSFQAQLHELFCLDIERDYVKKTSQKPYFTLTYSHPGRDNLVKTCKVSKHKENNKERLKVVPRGSQEGWTTSEDAKVEIPTLFLSMSRMLPNGEYQDNLSVASQKLSPEDITYIREKFKKIIDHKVLNSDNITKQELKGTTKKSLLPEFEHSSKTLSLGQDSLGIIITALASFAKLQREYNDYQGGILLIDEIDAGFHPRAQEKLIRLLKKEARDLQLQIIMTSHSLTILKEVRQMSDETSRYGRNVDSIVYIHDVLNPKLLEFPTYENVKQDMLGLLPPCEISTPQIKVYFEDKEAEWFCKQILHFENFDCVQHYQHDLKYVSAKLGCTNLQTLYSVDNYFHSVIIVFDNDVLLKDDIAELVSNTPTILTLPTIIESNIDDQRTPEFQLYYYLNSIITNVNHPYWNTLPSGYNMELIKDTIIDTFPQTAQTNEKLRDSRKTWFNQHKAHFERTNLINYYMQDNQSAIVLFMNDFNNAIATLIANENIDKE